MKLQYSHNDRKNINQLFKKVVSQKKKIPKFSGCIVNPYFSYYYSNKNDNAGFSQAL